MKRNDIPALAKKGEINRNTKTRDRVRSREHRKTGGTTGETERRTERERSIARESGMIGERSMKGGNEMLRREKKRSACSPSGSTRYRAIIGLSNCEARSARRQHHECRYSGGKRQHRMQISGNSSVTDRWVKKKKKRKRSIQKRRNTIVGYWGQSKNNLSRTKYCELLSIELTRQERRRVH